MAPWSRSPAADAISSVLALCSSAAAVTSSLAEACSRGGLTHFLGPPAQLLHDLPVRRRLPLHLPRRAVHLARTASEISSSARAAAVATLSMPCTLAEPASMVLDHLRT